MEVGLGVGRWMLPKVALLGDCPGPSQNHLALFLTLLTKYSLKTIKKSGFSPGPVTALLPSPSQLRAILGDRLRPMWM
jgi:hypothetical protein